MDWKKIERDVYLEAAIGGFNGDNMPMAKVFNTISDVSVALNKPEDPLKKRKNIIKITP